MKLWIARDKAGFISLHEKSPIWRKNRVNSIEDWHDGEFLCYLDNNEFPDVTFKNSPQQVEIKLVVKEE